MPSDVAPVMQRLQKLQRNQTPTSRAFVDPDDLEPAIRDFGIAELIRKFTPVRSGAVAIVLAQCVARAVFARRPGAIDALHDLIAQLDTSAMGPSRSCVLGTLTSAAVNGRRIAIRRHRKVIAAAILRSMQSEVAPGPTNLAGLEALDALVGRHGTSWLTTVDRKQMQAWLDKYLSRRGHPALRAYIAGIALPLSKRLGDSAGPASAGE